MTTGAMRGSSKPIRVGVASTGSVGAVAAVTATNSPPGAVAAGNLDPFGLTEDLSGPTGNGWIELDVGAGAFRVLKAGYYQFIAALNISGTAGDTFDCVVNAAGVFVQASAEITSVGVAKMSFMGAGPIGAGELVGSFTLQNEGSNPMTGIQCAVTVVLVGTYNP